MNSKCILWTKAIDKHGYGRVKRDGKWKRAHRVAWEETYGHIPEGIYVCHKCDVRSCIEPTHLFLGTHKDNMEDMYKKGRGLKAVGARNKKTKLTPIDILAIRESSLVNKELSIVYGVSASNISSIKSRQTWRHI